jgi:L-lactate dehydrogenase
MQPIRKDAVLILVINPVDILTHFAQELSGLAKTQVIGSGTFLDSVRLRSLLAREAKVCETDIHVHVLGEHGDSQFVGWTAATVAGTALQEILPLEHDRRDAMANATKNKAYDIIKVKGSTAYGIAAVVTSICESILFDHRQVMAVSHWQDDFQCCVSMPAIVGRQGILGTIPVALNDEERESLDNSVRKVKETIDRIGEAR